MLEKVESKIKAAGGTLYIIGTPIGNLEDITLRAIGILKSVDWIAAEDTRHSGQLLHHFGIKKPMLSYFEHNKRARSASILNLLLEGNSVGLISDAGMPGISDPGTDIIQECINKEIPVSVIPGPSALITALVASGLDTDGFAFGGFFPRENKPRGQWLTDFGVFPKTIIFYESPHRLIATLERLYEAWGDRQCCVARELTKRFEEFNRGKLSKIIEELSQRSAIKGEIVVAVAGVASLEVQPINWSESDLLQMAQNYINEGSSKKEVSQILAQKTGVAKRDIYHLLVQAIGSK